MKELEFNAILKYFSYISSFIWRNSFSVFITNPPALCFTKSNTQNTHDRIISLYFRVGIEYLVTSSLVRRLKMLSASKKFSFVRYFSTIGVICKERVELFDLQTWSMSLCIDLFLPSRRNLAKKFVMSLLAIACFILMPGTLIPVERNIPRSLSEIVITILKFYSPGV